jgi:hypothetical protein
MIATSALSAREADVLRCLHREPIIHYFQAAQVCRILNIDGPCEWCRILPPKPGERCAVIPKGSLRKVKVILKRLYQSGVLQYSHFNTFRKPMYRLETEGKR